MKKMGKKSENFQYIYIGQPPNQPRLSNFVPKDVGIGRASVVDEKCLKSERLIAGNLSALEKYDIDVSNISFYLKAKTAPKSTQLF